MHVIGKASINRTARPRVSSRIGILEEEQPTHSIGQLTVSRNDEQTSPPSQTSRQVFDPVYAERPGRQPLYSEQDNGQRVLPASFLKPLKDPGFVSRSSPKSYSKCTVAASAKFFQSGKIAFIGMMRLSTILIFVVSCTVVAPAFYAAEYPWYIPPATFAQQSREHMLSYLQNVPRTATLSIETMKFNFYPRRTQVAISDLAPGKSLTRPVSFINTNPQPQPWWRGKDGVHFYTPEANRPAKSTPKFFPEAWERVFAQIKQNSLLMKNK
ncbi:hypothetical protein CPC735_063500 [Coccidioides posadasii C735 delta SOWgp]|uniref:Uncharacterized protein n=1 Tax=Coccidioides posadasii (strain C735) TaxID=222929 RepID=C5P459_COCP7|nr:hypothetical protein CPC735_063500 [Coccidioides posadasii C735 delta SOWgp]EER28477.1 hypothetical protein CPC735_063500 [Coccidioides posadasii C735 delta SOWgp]|eukprot:XP_003070622.1 hypothetical protein CPC735_063500 [Coccidioides posadasii C735 delta SOWgp]